MSHTLCNGRIDGVFADIPLDPEIIRSSPLILFQGTPLHLILMRCIPSPQNNLATPPHSLRIRAHHTDSTKIMQNIFSSDGLSTDT